MAKYDVISFLSDMGTSDESVGVCKAIMHQQAPHATIIDITHDVTAFDVRAGALALTRAIQFLPKGVVVAAVDPGAPLNQRYIAVEMDEGVLIGPDNGILAPAAQLIGQPKRVVELTNTEFRIDSPGGVFSARDILAPAAGVIASGTDLLELGPLVPLEQLVPGMLQLSRHDEGGALLGEVWSVDKFGNIQLNITPEELEARNVNIGDTVTVRVNNNDFMAKFVERYADLAQSQLGILIDSTGMISVVKNLDFATVELGTREGKEVIILAQGTSVTGRDVTMENVQQPPANASIEDAAQSLMQGLSQQGTVPPQAPVPSVPAPMSAPEPQQPQAPAQPFTPFPGAPVEPTPPTPPAQSESPFGTMPIDAPSPFVQPVAEQEQQPQAQDPFAAPMTPDPASPSQGSGYLSGPAPSGPIPVPGNPFAFTQPEPEQSPVAPLPSDFPFGAPPVEQPPAAAPVYEQPVEQPPAQPAAQWGVPAQPQQAPAPFDDSPAAYFPPPVEEPTSVAPDVAPTYDQPMGAPQVENLSNPVPEVPENVFDLFKVVDEDEDYTDPDSQQTP